MSTLLLMRHAKSSWDDADCTDHDRPLNSRGLRDAPQMGRWLQAQGLRPARIITSSARRARHTAELVAAAFDPPPPIVEREDLYHATVDQLARALLALTAADDVVLVIGHNPGLEGLLNEWTGQAQRLPTAAVARLDVEAAARNAPRVKLRSLWRPKHLPEDFA